MSKTDNLRGKTISGFKWSFLDNVGKAGGQFVIGIILARILTPADFGLIGMITIFIVIGQSLTNSGFGQALIQNKNADNIDFSTVFYFNILASLAVYLVIYATTPLIADFYNEPRLIPLTKVICISFIFNALGLIHIVHLEKKLDFKAPSIVGVTSVVVAGFISIFLAYKNFGVWALVVNTVLRSIIATMMLWWVSKWRPMLRFSIRSLKKMFGYGSKILIAGIIQSIFQNIYLLIIGRFFTAQSLGYYTRALHFKDLPVRTITVVVQKVTFPVFSTIQDEDHKLIPGYTKTIRLLTMTSLAFMMLIFITAKPMVLIVLGEKWLQSVPYLKLMALYGWIFVLYTINNQIITVKGRSDYYLHVQVIDKVLIVLSIFLTYRFGIMAMIFGHMVATIGSYIVSSIYLNRIIDISLNYQFKNIFPFLLAALLMTLSSVPLENLLTNEFVYFFSSIAVAMIVYILVLWILRVEELKTGMKLIRSGISRFSLLIGKTGN